ncbi:MAG: hypothetical protein ACREXI_07875, partial [Caldimonas sp.]
KDTHGTVIRLAPPLTIERAQIDAAVAALGQALERIAAAEPAAACARGPDGRCGARRRGSVPCVAGSSRRPGDTDRRAASGAAVPPGAARSDTNHSTS